MQNRIVTAFLNQDAALGAGVSASLVFNNAQPVFEVPMDFSLMLTLLLTTLLQGTVIFEVSELDVSNNVMWTRRFAVSGTANITPPLAFKSGSRARIQVTNTGIAASGGAACYSAQLVLVPSVDFDTEKYPESVPPYFPRPF